MIKIMNEQERFENNRSLIKRCIGRLINAIKTEVPEKGKFTAHIFCYDEPVSKNEMRMAIMPDSLDAENSRRLQLAVTVGDSGYQIESYMKKGSNSEILEYLQRDGTAEELLKRLTELDKKAEDKKGEYPFY